MLFLHVVVASVVEVENKDKEGQRTRKISLLLGGKDAATYLLVSKKEIHLKGT